MTIGTKTTWGMLVTLIICVGIGAYYFDLLKAAVASNPIPRSSQSLIEENKCFSKTVRYATALMEKAMGLRRHSLQSTQTTCRKLPQPHISPMV